MLAACPECLFSVQSDCVQLTMLIYMPWNLHVSRLPKMLDQNAYSPVLVQVYYGADGKYTFKTDRCYDSLKYFLRKIRSDVKLKHVFYSMRARLNNNTNLYARQRCVQNRNKSFIACAHVVWSMKKMLQMEPSCICNIFGSTLERFRLHANAFRQPG